MRKIRSALQTEFEASLRYKVIPQNALPPYFKWLDYYPDFCRK